MGIASCPLARKSRRPAAEAAGGGDKARRAAGGPEGGVLRLLSICGQAGKPHADRSWEARAGVQVP